MPLRDEIVLAGDVGGTKTALGFFRRGAGGCPRLLVGKTYASREAASLTAILDDFLGRHPLPAAGACLGVAGAVIGDRVRPTNLSWSISRSALCRRYGWSSLVLVNDLVATAHAVRWLRSRDFSWLQGRRRSRRRNLGLIAPGTGLGMSLLIREQGHSLAVASEGGHLGFAPGDEAEIELWRWLQGRGNRITLETVLSGPGLVNIYAWLRAAAPGAAVAGDAPEPVTPGFIVAGALEGRCPVCQAALTRFVTILGRAAGDLALMGLTLGGVFLAGGIPPKILPALKKGDFLAAFSAKGELSCLVRRIPVAVITNVDAALIGAAVRAFAAAGVPVPAGKE